MKKSLATTIVAGALALSMAFATAAFADPAGAVNPPSTDYTGWVNANGNKYWFDSGVMARSKEIFDPGSDAWYWLDADGTMAHDKDVYQHSNGGKWVRYDANGHMIKGEQYSTKAGHVGWYYFDPITGAMAKGMRYVPSNGGKWVYYDWITGIMAHGEQFVNYDGNHTGWYLFDQVTGAMYHGDTYIRSNGGKWVRYDRVTGKMVKGLHHQDGSYYYFDQTTGAMAHSRVWVPEWNAYATFDSVTGRLVNNNSNSGNTGGNTGGTGRNIRGQWCKSREQGTQKLDGDGTPIVCECRNGNKRPHWYAR